METLGNQIQQNSAKKSAIIFNCLICDYVTSRKFNYETHLNSTKHKINTNMDTFGNQIQQKSAKKYVCNICDYETKKRYNYDNHINSNRHNNNQQKISNNQQKISNNQQKISNNQQNIGNNEYKCDNCDKEYKGRAGLWKHTKICNNTNTNDPNMMNFVLELVKQNTEFKELLVEQNKQNQNLQNQFIEMTKGKTMTNCNNTNNISTTNNNNNFNLNLFLNETCKNAMNINEFVEQISVSISDLEDTARLGYVEGISRIFINGLKDLEVNERPIHCSDAKRETLYIKEGDIWEKDDSDKTRLTNAIRKVGHKNIRMIPEWKKKYPDCEDYYSNKNDLYLKIVNQSMSRGSEEETETNYHKIRKNIIKQVVIDK
jgi:hypothetical protein